MPTKNLNGSKGGAADSGTDGARAAKPRFVRFTFPRNPSDDDLQKIADVETFRLDVDVSAGPGPVTLNTRELYPSGATVDWPATLTVVPGSQDEASGSIDWGWTAAIVGVGLIFVAGLAVLAWRRRAVAVPTR